MTGNKLNNGNRRFAKTSLLVGAMVAALGLSACNSTQKVFQHGYQINEETLSLVPEGSSRDQVDLSLGTPSTTQRDENGNETYYYISQKRVKSIAFAQGEIVDQRVLAVYFDNDDTVRQIANYGLKDGKVFDHVARVTPTGGAELSFLSQLFSAAGSIGNPFGGAAKSNDPF
jgi:outer membrane protein assembly factor BamE (lipoprotein component of BamABCDE complex)